MVTKTKIDSEDLLKLKQEILEWQQKDRHDLKWHIQNLVLEVDEVKTDIAIHNNEKNHVIKMIDNLANNLKTHMETEEKNFTNFATSIKDEIKSLRVDMKTEYATKIEHQQNKNSIDELRTLLKWALWWIIVFVFGAVWTAIMNLILK